MDENCNDFEIIQAVAYRLQDNNGIPLLKIVEEGSGSENASTFA